MAIRWCLPRLLAERGMSWNDLDALTQIGIDETWGWDRPPRDAMLWEVIAVCQALGCQLSDLLVIDDDDPAAQAERNLAGDMFYQSFLAHRAAQEEDEED